MTAAIASLVFLFAVFALAYFYSRFREQAAIWKVAGVAVMLIAVTIGGAATYELFFPGAPLAKGDMSPQQTLKFVAPGGPMRLTVHAHLPPIESGSASASYEIDTEGGGKTERITGVLTERFVRQRITRKVRGRVLAKKEGKAHDLPAFDKGTNVTLTAAKLKGFLPNEITVEVVSAPADVELFDFIGIALILLAAFIDARNHKKSYYGVGTAILAGYAFFLPISIEHDAHIPNVLAVGALSAGVFFLVALLVRKIVAALFEPK